MVFVHNGAPLRPHGIEPINYVISAIPVECGKKCLCHYIQKYQANSMTCDNMLPPETLNMTNWLTVTGGNIGELCGNFNYLSQISNLNLSSNGITDICESFMEIILNSNATKWIDLSRNKLTFLSRNIMQGHFERIWLSGNEFECNCDMLWMADWLDNSASPFGGHLIGDYDKVLCNNNKYVGMPIFKLNATYMKCLPSVTVVPAWAIGLISGAGILIIVIVIAMIAIARRWNEVKFWLFMHFDILDKNDDDLGKLDGIQFDALLSYA